MDFKVGIINQEMELFIAVIILSISFLLGKLMDRRLRHLIAPETTKHTVLLVMLVTGLFLWTDGITVSSLIKILYGIILIFAAEYDRAVLIVPDYVSVLILMMGLLLIIADGSVFLPAVMGLIFVPLPLIVAALIKEGSIGGADIKIMGASGFVLGVTSGYLALVIGLFVAILCQSIFNGKVGKGKAEKDKNGKYPRNNSPFPLVPYLAFGLIISAIVSG